ncbi:MAG TPA: ATP-binding protein [Flavitalea sp.]|nr:ATP-binding protein [Flavitalea sp.]
MSLIQKAGTFAELEAKKALIFPAFSVINLENLKSKVESILGLIGKSPVFKEYTKHDISHINQMLKSLEWIIPKETQEKLKPGEWLMIVLSVYFHDLGMLVTDSEFERRYDSDFKFYKEKILSGEYGNDYLNKVKGLGDNIDAFLYQEFVRKHHAERIKTWVTGKGFERLGCSHSIVGEVQKLIGDMEPSFKRDLSLICESHHLDDLDDVSKYKVKQGYGTHDEEQVNLQYCAVILRTADLLHITSDRTPSIEFYLINPLDPISQREWSKQMAVKNVTSKDRLDKDGNVDLSLQPDTISVIAYFNNPDQADSFFGLIDYLSYAQSELIKSFNWISESNKRRAVEYHFPWRKIDDSAIETEGFERKLFEFVLDQQKILSLLVGHTLYNDSSVVIRELVQNSIDAIKLHAHENKLDLKDYRIKVSYNSETRNLTIVDNGIGMTQEVIENHLLKVGSSRYQDESFKKKYPEFSPISRFGIGILTCFMISNDIEISTSTEDDSLAKVITIRKVDGKYLLKHVDKSVLPELGNRGTVITLKARQDVSMNAIDENLKKWVIYPPCPVEFILDNTPSSIGYNTLSEALQAKIQKFGMSTDDNVKIIEKQLPGVTLAYAIKFDQYRRKWSFLSTRTRSASDADKFAGTCIEGIAVEFNAPGFKSNNVLAIANVSGNSSPKTNVARSNFERNQEYNDYLSGVYGLYADFIQEQITELQHKFNYSLTLAVKESFNLMAPLTNFPRTMSNDSQDQTLLLEKLSGIPCILIEEEGRRINISANAGFLLREFSTIDSELFRNAEYFIKEVEGNLSMTGLIGNLGIELSTSGILMCSNKIETPLHLRVFSKKEIKKIDFNDRQRRLDLKWASQEENKQWLKYVLTKSDRRRPVNTYRIIHIQIHDIDSNTGPNVYLLHTANHYIFFKGNSLYDMALKLVKFRKSVNTRASLRLWEWVAIRFLDIILATRAFNLTASNVEKFIERFFKEDIHINENATIETFYQIFHKEEFTTALFDLNGHILDSTLWFRELETIEVDSEF